MNSVIKPTILIFSRYYLPGHLGGGPIRSIANMIDALSDCFNFLVLTLNHDLGQENSYRGIKYDTWVEGHNAKIFYASSKSLRLGSLLKILEGVNYDILYLNSFFDKDFTIKPLVLSKLTQSQRKPVVLAPRGEFSIGAIKIKQFKKSIYLTLAKWSKLYANVIYQASTEHERNDILREFFDTSLSQFESNSFHDRKTKILVAPDIFLLHNISPDVSNVEQHGRRDPEKLRVCFLSRISPKKNLDFALRVLSNTKSSIEFTIFGPKEDLAYWSVCMSLIENLPNNVTVIDAGSLEQANVISTLCHYDVFLFPTLGENFGHVILEAWSAGLPVIISDQTPWTGLSESGIGWEFSLSRPAEYSHKIDEISMYDEIAWTKLRKSCIAFVDNLLNDDSTLSKNRDMCDPLIISE